MKKFFEIKHPNIDILKNQRKGINSYDIETYEKDNFIISFCVSIIFKGQTYSFYDKNVIIRSVIKIFKETEKSEKTLIYIHNLDYDGFLILEEVSKYKKLKIDFLIHKMKIYYLRIHFSGRCIEFRCSKKILPASLKNIAEDFSLPPKMPYPYSFINEKNLYFKGRLEWEGRIWDYIDLYKYSLKYCERDVEITSKFINHIRNILLKDQNIDILKNLTISSLSLNVFSKNFNYRKVPLNTKRNLDLVLREAYFGGRCEIFGNTKKKVYHYDFPGMYGLCMQEKYPLSHPKWCPVDKIDLNNLKPGFYNITWESPSLRIPILPVKNEYGKLIFPNGIHSGTYWFEEVNFFVKNGGKVLKFNNCLVYDNYDYVFDKFIDYFSSFRKKGGVYKILGKLIINSLYGKLGTGLKKTKYLIAYSNNELEQIKSNFEIISVVEMNKIYIIEIEDSTRLKGINVGLAAAITSKARIKLTETMIYLESKGGRMLYCDTDSVFVEFEDKIDTSIIKWNEKDSIYDSAVFALPKTYALIKGNESLVRIKGVPKNSISFYKFKEKFENNEFLLFEELFQTKKKDFKIKMGNTNKRIDLSAYDKRIFDNEKINTHV